MNNFMNIVFFVVVGSDCMHLQFSLLTSKRNIHTCILVFGCNLPFRNKRKCWENGIKYRYNGPPTSTSRTEVRHVTTFSDSVQSIFYGGGRTIAMTMMNNILAQTMPLLFPSHRSNNNTQRNVRRQTIVMIMRME
jgi:hypothetical protein